MELVFAGEGLPSEEVQSHMEKAALKILEREGVTNEDIEIDVTFIDDEGIRELNNSFRDTDKVTDVLSFPQFNEPGEIPREGPAALGDVVICRDQALRQAEEYGHSAERELVYLFVHSIFHLMGYDHIEDEEKREMRAAEEEIMSLIGLER